MDIVKLKRFIQATEFYQKQGFVLIDVPWFVDKETVDITLPVGNRAFHVNPEVYKDKNNYLVGSAEQSFIQLIRENKLKHGKWMALTPCFRDDVEDKYHHKYFMKLELMQYEPKLYKEDLTEVVYMSKEFFENTFPCEIEFTDIGMDLVESKTKVELGSYGFRSFDNEVFIYGTGLAEPRFSEVLETRESDVY